MSTIKLGIVEPRTFFDHFIKQLKAPTFFTTASAPRSTVQGSYRFRLLLKSPVKALGCLAAPVCPQQAPSTPQQLIESIGRLARAGRKMERGRSLPSQND